MTEVDVDIQVPVSTPVAGLTIAEIETIAIRVPLARTYRGSAYRMTHRSTIVTRIRTEEGIVGEAYCGRRGRRAARDRRDRPDEIAPRAARRGRVPRRALLGARPTGDVRHPARPPARPRRDGVCGRRHLGRDRQGARPAALPPVGRVSRQPPVITIGGYYGGQEIAAGGRGAPRAGPRRHEVQGRRAHPRGGRGRASGPRAPPPGPTSSSAPTPTRAGRRPRRSASPVSSRTATSLVRGAVHAGRTTGARCGTSASRRAFASARARASSPQAGAAT